MSRIGQLEMSQSYEFTFGTNKVTDRTGKSHEMIKNLAQQSDEYIRGSLTKTYAYINEEDATKFLGISSEYVDNSEYGVFLTERMEKKAKGLYEAIETAVQEFRAEENQ